METINLDELSKEQTLILGMLFGLSYSGKKPILNARDLQRDELLSLCREMNLKVNDTYFYLDFISHNMNRYDLARKYQYAVCSIYSKFKSIDRKVQKYFINSKKFIDFL